MENKPTMMNQEWLSFVNKVQWLCDRINQLEARVDILEHGGEEDEEESE